MFFKVSSFDHGSRRGTVMLNHRPPAPWQIGRQTFRCIMPEYQPVSSTEICAIERPRCPNCRRNRMLLSKLEQGPAGFDYRSFECQKCGRIQTTVAERDPLTSDARGWLVSELKPPT